MSLQKIRNHQQFSYSPNTSKSKEQKNPENYHRQAQQTINKNSKQQDIIKCFQFYRPQTEFISMDQLAYSERLVLKKYKEAVYYGEMINHKKQGPGIMIYYDGRFYEGSWKNDYKNGIGYEEFKDKCKYKGQYAHGKPNGIGKYQWVNGEFYEGQWKNGLKHGSGMWKGSEGDSYVGQWKHGKPDGYGVHVWSNGDNYEGQFKNSLKHGSGIQKFSNGDIYKGSYLNGKPNGYGQYFWANGSYFKGEFKNGLRDGEGFWKKNPGIGDNYQGQYMNDKKHGSGVFKWQGGNVYKGNYQADMRHGYGQMHWNDGSYYKGQWNKGIQHGKGELYVPRQGYKIGTFKDNILIIVQEQFEEQPYHNTQPVNKKTVFKKDSFRSRQTYKRHSNKSIDETSLPKSLNKKTKIQQKKYQTIVPQSKNQFRQTKYTTVNRRILKKQSNKERVLHSSFYLHRQKQRVHTAQSGGRLMKNVQKVRRSMFEEMGLSQSASKWKRSTIK